MEIRINFDNVYPNICQRVEKQPVCRKKNRSQGELMNEKECHLYFEKPKQM